MAPYWMYQISVEAWLECNTIFPEGKSYFNTIVCLQSTFNVPFSVHDIFHICPLFSLCIIFISWLSPLRSWACLFNPSHLYKMAVRCIYPYRGPWFNRMTIQRARDEVYCEQLILCTAGVHWGPWWLSAGLPTTALSDFLCFALPAALHVLEASIGPELDCGRPDYWCQCVPRHVGMLERRVPSPR